MQWHDRYPRRLSYEVQSMKKSFPHARLFRLEDGRLAWELTLQTNSKSTYLVEIVYPSRFPDDYPLAYVVDPPITEAPHMYRRDHHLCLFAADDDPDRTYVPERTTAATIACWSSAWLFCYEQYTILGYWPERGI